MSKIYEVEVSRLYIFGSTIKVEANSILEAEGKALEQMNNIVLNNEGAMDLSDEAAVIREWEKEE